MFPNDHKELYMRKYELMTIFPIEEDLSKAAQESVRSILGEFGAEIENETPYGDRDLCYEVKKRNIIGRNNLPIVVRSGKDYKICSSVYRIMCSITLGVNCYATVARS